MPHKLLAVSAVLFLLACNDTAKDQTPCVDDSKGCGETCEVNADCASGLFCAPAGECGKACDDAHPCEGELTCTPRGECIDPNGSDADGGSKVPMISGGGQVDDDDAGSFDAGEPAACAAVTLDAQRVIPTVYLIVDQSGSMDEPFTDTASRWDALRSFLLDDMGLISSLQDQVKFGLAMYSSRSIQDGTAVDGECPIVTSVAPKRNNYDGISEVYGAAEPIKETPTGDSITAVLDSLNLDEVDPDTQRDPIVFILATDGEPDRCEDPNPTTDEGRDTARQETIDAVKTAFEQKVRTFIISVGDGTVSEEHQQAVANAGVGNEAGDPDAEFWVAGNDESLREALQKIIGDQVSCDIKLEGQVDESVACEGTVTLGGDNLGCSDKNGWKLVGPKKIRLVGNACKKLKESNNISLNVSFPCGTEIVF